MYSSGYFSKLTQDIFLIHLRRLVENLFGLILGVYGRPWKICPSPLLSCLLEGCMESGRDLERERERLHFDIRGPLYVQLWHSFSLHSHHPTLSAHNSHLIITHSY